MATRYSSSRFFYMKGKEADTLQRLSPPYAHHPLLQVPHLSFRQAISPHFKRAISKRVGMSTRPDVEGSGVGEIAIRSRPRLPIVLDLLLRARLACLHGRGLCPSFRPGLVGVVTPEHWDRQNNEHRNILFKR